MGNKCIQPQKLQLQSWHSTCLTFTPFSIARKLVVSELCWHPGKPGGKLLHHGGRLWPVQLQLQAVPATDNISLSPARAGLLFFVLYSDAVR
jgi:hypothetical protein